MTFSINDVGLDEPVQMSCSIGFACYPFVPSAPGLFRWENVIGIADCALYTSKNAGRNAWVGVFSTEEQAGSPSE